jgi:4-hydroxy-tetrahydrodipicolinate synthase
VFEHRWNDRWRAKLAANSDNAKKSGATLPGGIYAASLTPLKDDSSIAHELLAAHCNHLLGNGCDGIALFGTTGEASSYTVGERICALDAIVGGGVPANRLLVGTGCTAIPDTVALTRHAIETGAGGVLVIPPFFFKNVSDAGVINA